MEGMFNNRQIVVTENKRYPDFHTSDWMSMIIDVTSIGGGDKKWLMNRSASSI